MTVGRLPGESPEYAKVRDELQQAEVALRDQRERVAELRRSLPGDQVVADTIFREIRDGQPCDVALSELFDESDKPVVLMHFMYGGSQTSPCPMCTSFADGYDGALPHLAPKLHFAALIAGDPGAFGEYARSRGWENLRVLGTGDSDLKRRLGFETEDGGQLPGVSVFTRNTAGEIVHFYSQCALLGEAGFRGMDLFSPVWHYLDITPGGRGDFFPSKAY